MAEYASIISAFNKAFQSRTQLQMYGDPSVTDTIQKPEGTVLGIKYNIGDGTKAIRYCFDNNKLISVDFWLQPGETPQFTMPTGEYQNLVKVVEPAAAFILTGNPKQFMLEHQDAVIRETKEDSEDVNPFDTFINMIATKYHIKNLEKQSVKDLPPVLRWAMVCRDNQENAEIQNLFRKKSIAPLWRDFNNWVHNSKIKLEKPERGGKKAEHDYGKFYDLIGSPLEKAGFARMQKVQIQPARQEKIVVNQADLEIFNKVKEEYKLTPDETFEQIETYVEAVVDGRDYSLIVAGDPGIGKTTTIQKKLEAMGKSPLDSGDVQAAFDMEDAENDMENEDDFDNDSLGGKTHTLDPSKYIFISGKISVYALYTLMYEYNGALIIFDDCDSVFDDANGVNLIKAATDDKPVRKLVFRNANTTSASSDIPWTFDYRGRIIFITNLYLKDLDTAIVSRALVVEVNLSPGEAVERIRKLLPHLLKTLPGATEKIKVEVLDFLLSMNKIYTKLDFRTYEQAVKEKLRGSPNWQKLVVNSIIAKRGISR